jgi:fluoride ion exporter CrcB/FEX
MVAVGGLLGVLARFGLSRLTLHHETLLWTTVGINVAGSFLLGGFTTFSTSSVQIVLEVDAGRPARAVARVAASVLGGIAAAAAATRSAGPRASPAVGPSSRARRARPAGPPRAARRRR